LGSVHPQSLSQSFTIHGYWPQTRSNEKYGEFSLDIFDEKLLKDMKNYWPAQTRRAQKSSTFLWEHEYESHGSDFAEIYRYQHEDAFPGTNVTAEDITLQRTYFHYVIKLYKTLKVQKIEKSSYSKAEFADYLGINANSFSLVCNEKTATLQEIRICYDITPEGSKIVTCRSVSARNCKGNQIVLGEWKKSSPTAPVNKA
jgi:ribonuclease I